jgi:1-aminocyclopropane-1-carboxylate deaminase/D-cysteine desulfhydrase-like pyridoxal-dependent ACC family enzyme
VDDAEYLLHDGWIGAGYGIPTAEGLAAIRTAAGVGGVFLDPTYTGKAFAALIDAASRGAYDPLQPIVFLHTGGEPALFTTGVAS